MDVIHRFAKPVLRRPRALIAFEGWNDACEAASGAVTYLLGQYGFDDPFAVVEPDEFYDFQAHRPTVSIGDGNTRSLSWPTTRFYAAPVPEESSDLILVIGEEPSYRWKTFSRHVTALLTEMGVEQVLLMGAFIGQVAHTRPVPIIGVSTDAERVFQHGLMSSRYEGPTGIVGVMQEACREEGIPSMSLWAATPHYLAANPNPNAMLALLQKAGEVLDLNADLGELRTVSAEFSDRVEQAVTASDDFAEYVSQLEEEGESAGDPDMSDGQALNPRMTNELVSEIEDFLRNQR